MNYAMYDEKCITDNLSRFSELLDYTSHQFDSPCKDCCSLEGCKNFYLEKTCTNHETTYRIWTWRFGISHVPENQR